MANLSGQTIQSTYPGLLNLNVATTGITSTPQAITDGFGNDTGIDIATNYLAAPNIANIKIDVAPQYMGNGIQAGSGTNPALTQNRLIYGFFYDPGLYAYSAITLNLVTATTTSDVTEMYFYTPQWVDGYGIAPKDLITSGITIPSTAPLGFRTTTFANNFSFSGYGGGGYYIYAFRVSNANVSPSVRYGVTPLNTYRNGYEVNGFVIGAAATSYGPSTRLGAAALNVNTQVQSSYSAANIASNWQNTSAINWGFILHTVK